MPTIAEAIDYTREFQSERKGLSELNDIAHCLFRIDLELKEAEAALYTETREELLNELFDIYWFTVSAMLKVAEDLGIEPEEVDERAIKKTYKNEERYQPEHFNPVGQIVGGKEYTAFDGTQRARHHHKNGFNKGNDVY